VKHLSEEQLILYYYRESENLEKARRHLDECASCRAELAAIEQLLAEVTPEPVPERPADYEQRVWRRLESELTADTHESWLDWLKPRRLAWAGAAAVLVAAVFLAGRFSTRWDEEANAPTVAEVRERVLLVALGDHLESSQILLMELANTSETEKPETINISFERQMASELVGQNRLYRQTANRAGETALVSVLDELERMLIDIANSPENLDFNEFANLRRRIEAQGVLFKVRVLNTNVRERQRDRVTQKKL
jgi:hypothetical protein